MRGISRLGLIILILSLDLAVSSAQAAAPGQSFKDCPDCPEMVVILSGHFAMGSSDAEIERNLHEDTPYSHGSLAQDQTAMQRPQHDVSLRSDFSLGRVPVTKGEFRKFATATNFKTNEICIALVEHMFRTGPGPMYRRDTGATWENPGFTQTENDPVVCVSWRTAQAYIEWLNVVVASKATETGITGHYRLPSEAEWEYAARAGTRTERWWGDSILDGNANCQECGKNSQAKTIPVRHSGPNAFGLYDMLGNAWQWTEDCWNKTYFLAPADGSAWLTGSCSEHVARGGAWDIYAWVLNSAVRTKFGSDTGGNNLSFRLAKSNQ